MLGPKDSMLRQVVVKIRSKQSLAQFKRKGAAEVRKGEGEEELVAGTGEVKRLLEYLVIQRRIFKGVEGPWKIWGTTEETKAEEVLGEIRGEDVGEDQVGAEQV
ncbi:MAG: hypothetical protein Q9163_004217 [Psora crenata]